MQEFDIAIIGSGAGGGAIAYELSKAGAKVALLEKGDFYHRDDFSKDEVAYCLRNVLSSDLDKEYHVIERYEDGKWVARSTKQTRESYWNTNIVGGSTNIMGGYFHRLHPMDFKLLSLFGKIDGANIVDWPISYDELEPYYTKVENIVGVSGEVKKYKFLEPRSTKDFPFPPLKEHPISKVIDKTLKGLNLTSLRTPRAIISKDTDERKSCYYSNFCASYGCSSGAKGSSREALIIPALKTNNLTLLINSHVLELKKAKDNLIKEIVYIDKTTMKIKKIKAKIFVLSAGTLESIRLLFNSKLANSSGELGKNIVFGGLNTLAYAKIDEKILSRDKLFQTGWFVNRSVKDFYMLDEKTKGGVIDFLFTHQNPIYRANFNIFNSNGDVVFGRELQAKIYQNMVLTKQLNLEIFHDFLPHDNCFVTVDKKYKDIYGKNVAKLRISTHIHTYKIAQKLLLKAKDILIAMGVDKKNITLKTLPFNPPTNLIGGGCRFGDDKKKSVLNRFCQTFDHQNLFVVDGSFMPTGGSVPFTWTIYANSFRVADHIKNTRF